MNKILKLSPMLFLLFFSIMSCGKSKKQIALEIEKEKQAKIALEAKFDSLFEIAPVVQWSEVSIKAREIEPGNYHVLKVAFTFLDGKYA